MRRGGREAKGKVMRGRQTYGRRTERQEERVLHTNLHRCTHVLDEILVNGFKTALKNSLQPGELSPNPRHTGLMSPAEAVDVEDIVQQNKVRVRAAQHKRRAKERKTQSSSTTSRKKRRTYTGFTTTYYSMCNLSWSNMTTKEDPGKTKEK